MPCLNKLYINSVSIVPHGSFNFLDPTEHGRIGLPTVKEGPYQYRYGSER